jgi:hypothetical protein
MIHLVGQFQLLSPKMKGKCQKYQAGSFFVNEKNKYITLKSCLDVQLSRSKRERGELKLNKNNSSATYRRNSFFSFKISQFQLLDIKNTFSYPENFITIKFIMILYQIFVFLPSFLQDLKSPLN